MGKQADTEWIAAPPEGFDTAKFAEQYGLAESDFQSVSLNGETYLRIPTVIADRIGPDPKFEAPVKVIPKTQEDLALDMIRIAMPNATKEQRLAFLNLLLQFAGVRPPEMKPEPAETMDIIVGRITEQKS